MALLGGQIQFGVPSPGGPSMATWKTVAELVSDVALEEGIAQAPIVDPYGSADPNILQLTALLKSAGRSVVRERAWSHLQRELVFQTVAGQPSYGLPSDFREMVPQSGWDRTTLYQLGGPIGAEVWQLAQAIHIVGSVYPFIRFAGGQISFTPTPTSVQTIAFEYRSWFWVRPSAGTDPTSDAPTAATDILCFDGALMVCALKLAWEKAKRFDTATAQADYDRALAAAMNEDSAAPEIPIGSSGDSSPAQDVWSNVAQTGIGQ
jgi:hypothetical protein